MKRGARYLGTFGTASVWYFASAADVRRVFPSYRVNGATCPRGLWVEFGEGMFLAPPDLAAGGDLDAVCTGRAARVLRGLYHANGGGA